MENNHHERIRSVNKEVIFANEKRIEKDAPCLRVLAQDVIPVKNDTLQIQDSCKTKVDIVFEQLTMIKNQCHGGNLALTNTTQSLLETTVVHANFLKPKYKKRKWKPWPEAELAAFILLLSTFFTPGYFFTVTIPLVGAILSFSAAIFSIFVMITKPKRSRDRRKNMQWLIILAISGIANGIICIIAL